MVFPAFVDVETAYGRVKERPCGMASTVFYDAVGKVLTGISEWVRSCLKIS